VGARLGVCLYACGRTQDAARMRIIILSSVTSLLPPRFSTLAHKRYDFRKKLLYIKSVLSFSLHLILKHFSFQEEFNEILS
jgi:hypothetical protein